MISNDIRLANLCLKQCLGDDFRKKITVKRPGPPLIVGVAHLLVMALFLWSQGPLSWVALVAVCGVFQRLLGNLLHEASHFNLYGSQGVNDIFGEWFLAWPIFNSLSCYRRAHAAHHQSLGVAGKDPDFIEEQYRSLAGALFSKKNFLASNLGNWSNLDSKARLKVVALHILMLVMLSSIFGGQIGFKSAVCWSVAKATTYHFIRVFAEFSDHYGLPPGTILKYTRNAPRSVLNLVLHPYFDRYHLVHHLFPIAPAWRLHVLHKIMFAEPSYVAANRYDGYFFGKTTLMASIFKGVLQ